MLIIGVSAVLVALLASWLGAGQAAAWPWDNLGEKTEQAAKGILARTVNAILYALISLMKYIMTFFTAEKTNLDSNAFTSMIQWANDYTYQLQSVFLFISIVFVGGRFAIAQWTGGSQAAVTTGISVSVRALATSLGAATVVILLTRAADLFAAWIYDDTGEKVNTVTDELKKKIGTIDSHNFDGSSVLLIIIALIAILGCLDLLIQLFLRLFYLAFGTAMLPVTAAASGTEGGQATYSQVLKLLAAMIAFKPICAGAFALAMSYPLNDKSDAADVFIAVLLYIAPILCLPTLLSLVGVGGSVHGRVSGLAGVAALIGGGRVVSRLGGKATRGIGGAASRGGGSRGGGGRGGGGRGGGGGGGSRPSGTSPTPPRGRSGGSGGGRFAPMAAAFSRGRGGGGGAGSGPGRGANPRSAPPRSQKSSTAPSDSGTPRQSSQSGAGQSGAQTSTGGGRHATETKPQAADTSARRGPEPRTPRPDDSGTPRPARPAPSHPDPPSRTVGSDRSHSGDSRANAKSIARRNLGANYIGKR